MRTSLERVASSYTAEDKAEHLEAYERRLWVEHRAVVIRLGEPRGLPRLVMIAIEAWAKTRFEKKRAVA